MFENESIFGIDEDFDGDADLFDEDITLRILEEERKFLEEQEKEKNKLNIAPTYNDDASIGVDTVIGAVVLILPILIIMYFIFS